MRKPDFCICENKDADQLLGNREADQRLCFSYIVQSLCFLHRKFQAFNHLVWLYNPVCKGAGQKPRRPVFSQQGSYDLHDETGTSDLLCRLIWAFICRWQAFARFSNDNSHMTCWLAHLSRRLIGELIVYTGIRRPSVRRPSVNIFKRHLL